MKRLKLVNQVCVGSDFHSVRARHPAGHPVILIETESEELVLRSFDRVSGTTVYTVAAMSLSPPHLHRVHGFRTSPPSHPPRFHSLLSPLLLLLLTSYLTCPLTQSLQLTIEMDATGKFTQTDTTLSASSSSASPWYFTGHTTPSLLSPGYHTLNSILITSDLANSLTYSESSSSSSAAAADVKFTDLPSEIRSQQEYVNAYALGTNTTVSILSTEENSSSSSSSSSSVYIMKSKITRPYIDFLSSLIVCRRVLFHAQSHSFVCRNHPNVTANTTSSSNQTSSSSSSSSISFIANITSAVMNSGRDYSLDEFIAKTILTLTTSPSTAVLTITPSDPLIQHLLSLCYSHLSTSHRINLSFHTLSSRDSSRRSSARIFVVLLWIFILATAASAVVVASVWIPWALPCVATQRTRRQRKAMEMGNEGKMGKMGNSKCTGYLLVTLTFTIVSGLFTVVGIMQGMSGFLILLVFILFCVSIINLVYCSIRIKERHRRKYTKLLNMDELMQKMDRKYGYSVHSPSSVLTSDYLKQHKGGMPPHRNQPHHVSADAAVTAKLTNMEEGHSAQGAPAPPAAASGGRISLTPFTSSIQHKRNGSISVSRVLIINRDTTAAAAAVSKSTSPSSSSSSSSSFNFYPCQLGSSQLHSIQLFAFLILVFSVISVAIFGIWECEDYMIWDRRTQKGMVEFMPNVIAKATFLIYAFQNFASRIQINRIFFDVSTQWCGSHYSQELETNAQKYKDLYQNFIAKYDINMQEYVPSDYRQYPTVNHWFIRNLAPSIRPLTAPHDDSLILQPCDARLMVFATMPDDSFLWIKDGGYTIEGLIGKKAWEENNNFKEGSMALVRLAPQDYHQFHRSGIGEDDEEIVAL